MKKLKKRKRKFSLDHRNRRLWPLRGFPHGFLRDFKPVTIINFIEGSAAVLGVDILCHKTVISQCETIKSTEETSFGRQIPRLYHTQRCPL